MTLAESVDRWMLGRVRGKLGTYQVYDKYFAESLQRLINNGWIEKVKCNNAPDELEITSDGYVVGVFVTTDNGQAWLNFQKL